MNEKELELEARRLLESVLKQGTYHLGHIQWIINIASKERARLQEELKDLLNIKDCDHA